MKTSEQQSIMVWDPALRLFHWTLVLCFAVAYAFSVDDGRVLLHLIAGYVVIGLLMFRVIWGIAGSKYARFQSFTYSIAQTIEHLRGLLRGQGHAATGHNPAGAAMVFALLGMLTLIALSGLALDGIQRQGPLASLMWGVSHTWESTIRCVHEWLANIVMAMVVMHVAGALVESYLLRENLIRPMVTGRKIPHADHTD